MIVTTLHMQNAYLIFAAFITPIAITISLVYWKLYNSKINEISDLVCEVDNLKHINKDLEMRLERRIEEECMTDEQRLQVAVGKATIDVFDMLLRSIVKR